MSARKPPTKDTKDTKDRRGRRSLLPVLNTDDDDQQSGATTLEAAQPRRRTNPTITILSGMNQGQVVNLRGETTWIGRERTCEVSVPEKGVSRRHASITWTKDTFLIRDESAKNGTFVNGHRIREHALRPGDEIQLGAIGALLFYAYQEGAEDPASQQRAAARERLLTEQMYTDRLQSIGNMVTGVAHAINTPLGVAGTANAMMVNLATELVEAHGAQRDELIADLKECSALLSRSLERAGRLVQSFKQLSASQLSDEPVRCDVGELVRECVDKLAGEVQRKRVTFRKEIATGDLDWFGFPGHLVQIVTTLIQNAVRHAYKNADKCEVDVRVAADESAFSLEVQDYGSGIAPDIFPRVFEPFVSSDRENGSAGLGLAILHNVVLNLLHGKVSCTSAVGRGTTFVVRFPRELPR